MTTAFGQVPSQDNRGDQSRIERFQAQLIQSNELTLPDAARFPNDKKGSDERARSDEIRGPEAEVAPGSATGTGASNTDCTCKRRFVVQLAKAKRT
ncbi:MAG: hypothetical protein DME33_02015 [Verrucomicrobia bacterium]|nr:MAG: hypothetical protein DME33_02015 [Verrucomicrobiota bacterium]